MFGIDIDDFDQNIVIDIDKRSDILNETFRYFRNMDKPSHSVVKADKSAIRLNAGDLAVNDHSRSVIFDLKHVSIIQL